MATSKFSASIYILTCALKYFIVRSRRFIFVVRAKWNIYHFVARTYFKKEVTHFHFEPECFTPYLFSRTANRTTRPERSHIRIYGQRGSSIVVVIFADLEQSFDNRR